MKMLVGFLIFSMLSGASELLTLAVGDYIKGKVGRASKRRACKAGNHPGADRFDDRFKGGIPGSAGRVLRSEAEYSSW